MNIKQEIHDCIDQEHYYVEKYMEIACVNRKCKFWSRRYEQNCSGETKNGDPAIIICTKYIPDNHRITKGLKKNTH